MNVCYICRNVLRDRGGIETYTLEMARVLGCQGHSVHIIAEKMGDLSKESVGKGVVIHTVDFSEHPFSGYWKIDRLVPIDDLRFSMAVSRKIHEITRTSKIDIVEATDYFRSGFWYALHKVTPLLLRFHGWFFNRRDGRINPLGSLSLREKLLWHMQQTTIERADAVSFVSSDYADFASGIWKIGNKLSRVILNAVDASRFAPDRAVPREPSVLYVGRLIKNKGILVLADAIADILRHCPKVRFVFAGKDIFLKEVGCMAQDYVRRKAPSAQLVFLGEVTPEELVSYYRSSSVAVFPSYYDACPIACLEAMSCGSAIVASDVGGFKDMIRNEEQGLLIPVGKPQELGQAVVRFLEDATLRESCADNAFQKVVKEFNYDRMARETLAFYEEAIAHHAKS